MQCPVRARMNVYDYDRHLGMEQFWKEDAIFFDKIDNDTTII